MTDKHGHGTHVAGLLLAFARDAQLFIVKLDTTLGDASQKKVARVRISTALPSVHVITAKLSLI
jgi:hypothetical protein